jgi:hypothetical protein
MAIPSGIAATVSENEELWDGGTFKGFSRTIVMRNEVCSFRNCNPTSNGVISTLNRSVLQIIISNERAWIRKDGERNM